VSYTRSEIISGGFVIAAIVLFTLFAFEAMPLNPLRGLAGDALACETVLENANGIKPGTPVIVAGYEVGKVQRVELIQHTSTAQPPTTRHVARVRFTIKEPTLRLDQRTASVTLGQSGLLGRRFLALDPGRWQGEQPPLAQRDADEPLRIRGVDQPGIGQMIAQLQPLVERVNRITRKVDRGLLAERNVTAISDFLDDLHMSMQRVRLVLDANEGALDRKVLTPLNTVLTDASSSIRALRTRLMERTLPRAEKLMADGSAFAQEAKQVADEAEDVLASNRDRVRQLLEQAVSTARELETRLARVAEDTETLLARGDAMLTENRAEVAETVRRARRALWQAEMGLRKIRANPAVLFFGDDERLLGAEPIDASWLRHSGRAEPYQQRDEHE